MKTIVLIAFIAIPATAAARGSHGGGHGGGGHGGGGHGHSSGGSRTRGYSGGHVHSSGHSHTCTEAGDVVGYQQCSGFGEWSANVPSLSIDLGLAMHRFAGETLASMGSFVENSKSFGYRFGTEPGERLATSVIAPQLRVTVAIAGPLYVASEFEVGGVRSGPRVWGEIDGGDAGPIATVYGAMRAAVGLRARFEPVALSGELAGGARMLQYTIKDENATAFQTRGEVQARARLDLWLSPRMSLGAMVGTSLIDRGDTIVALSIGGHLRAFGGEP